MQKKLKFSPILAVLLFATQNLQAKNSDEKSQVVLEEIVVSANKMNENLKDIPQSISVLDEIQIEEKRIQNVTDVIRQIPNMYQTALINKTRVNFRGINHSDFTNSNPITVYVDGIPTSSLYGAYNANLNGVERVEVLRGPQTAIYGKDSIGGVINIVSRQPRNEWSGSVGAEYGSYNSVVTSADANGAIIDDKLYLNLGAFVKHDDGWIKNDYNGDKKASKIDGNRFNITLTATPTDRLTARLNLTHDKDKQYFYRGGTGHFGKVSFKDAKNAKFEVPTYSDTKQFSQSIGIDYEFDWAKLSSLTTHSQSKAIGIYDSDYTQGNANDGLTQFQDVRIKTLTQELRLANANSDKLKWIGGLYFENEKSENKRMGAEFNMGGVIGLQNVPAKFNAQTSAIFGQIDYEFVKDWRLVLGGRYQQIKKDMDNKVFLTIKNPPSQTQTFAFKEENKWHKFLPKVGLNFTVNENLSTFVSYSQGYLAGGYNYYATQGNSAQNRFGPQTSNNYEFGIHGNAVQNRLKYAATLFYMDIKDIHMYEILNGGRTFVTSNGGRASSQGVEIEASYYAENGFDISASLGINKTKYKENISSKTAVGKRIENTPSFNANLGLGYIHASGIYGRVDLHAVGTTYFDADNTEKQSPYLTADARIGYKMDKFDIYAYATNITNKFYTISFLKHPLVGGMNHFGEPRRVGVGVRYSF